MKFVDLREIVDVLNTTVPKSYGYGHVYASSRYNIY